MKILISCITYHPTLGGADDFVRSIAEGLVTRGHEVTVCASDLEKHIEGVKLADTAEKTLNGVLVVRCRSFNLPGHVYPVWPGLALQVRRAAPDLIHAFGLGYYSVDGAAGWQRRRPVIVSPTGGRYRRGRLYDLLGSHFLPKVEAVSLWTALSQSERRQLAADHPGHPGIEILSPSIDPDEWAVPLPDPFPGIPRGRRILYAGRLARDKGIDDLYVAFSRLRHDCPADLVLVGPDYGFKPPAESAGVHALGALDRKSLVAAYQHCDLLVLPSSHEGFGIVLLEAMAAGKPVIAYDNSSQPELVRDGENGLIVPTGDSQRLAIAMQQILDNRDLARSFGEAGRKRALGEFSRARMLDTAEAYYRRALARHQRVIA